MKVPRITREAMLEAAAEPVRPGAIYDWLEREQPELFEWADKRIQPEDDQFFAQRADILACIAFTLRSLSHMPEKAPPDIAITALQAIMKHQEIVMGPGAKLMSTTWSIAANALQALDKTPGNEPETSQERSGKPIGTTHGLLVQDKLERIRGICDQVLSPNPIGNVVPLSVIREIRQICNE